MGFLSRTPKVSWVELKWADSAASDRIEMIVHLSDGGEIAQDLREGSVNEDLWGLYEYLAIEMVKQEVEPFWDESIIGMGSLLGARSWSPDEMTDVVYGLVRSAEDANRYGAATGSLIKTIKEEACGALPYASFLEDLFYENHRLDDLYRFAGDQGFMIYELSPNDDAASEIHGKAARTGYRIEEMVQVMDDQGWI